MRRSLVFFAVGTIFALATLAVGWRVWRHRHAVATGPLGISLWYWRQPFRIPPGDAPTLKAMGITTLFVRTATITRDSDTGTLRTILPQIWAARPPEGVTVYLVFNADYGVIRNLNAISDDALHAAFASALRTERARAVAAGIPVVGEQLDFDCPTRLLPRYARLLASLRTDLRAMGAGRDTLSITALPTWLTSREVNAVADQVDFLAPQFYEAVVPKTFGDGSSFATIGDEVRLRRGIQRAGRLRTRLWVGLPAYGHALVYDGKGALRGAFHDAGVLDMARQPYYKFARAWPADTHGAPTSDLAHFTGEQIVDLEPTGLGVRDQTNFHLIYDLPTPTLVARQIAAVREDRPANCAGVILFRYPEMDATQSVPLPSLRAVWEGRTPHPHLKVLISTRAVAPWRAIEEVSASAPTEERTHDIYVTVTNDGDGAIGVAPNALDLAIRFDHPCLRDTPAPGGFDHADPFAGSPETRASIARADGVHLTGLHLAPGAALTAGPIRISADGAVTGGIWRVTGNAGFDVVQGSFDLGRAKVATTGNQGAGR